MTRADSVSPQLRLSNPAVRLLQSATKTGSLVETASDTGHGHEEERSSAIPELESTERTMEARAEG